MAKGSGSGGRGSGVLRGAGSDARATLTRLSNRLAAGGFKRGERRLLQRRIEIVSREIMGG